MPNIELWYHDENEVDERHSWLSNSPALIACTQRRNYENCSYSKVLALVEYARPDFILTVDGAPILSCEVTMMNPSGHNMPQRFSCLLRSAEMGVPSLFYYPYYARRSTSDPQPRYLNVRVPLAQLRLSSIFETPSLSLFWPTDPKSLQPTRDIAKHRDLAMFVEYTLNSYLATGRTLSMHDPEVARIQNMMRKASRPVTGYDLNPSFRHYFPHGDPFTKSVLGDIAIDPPCSCKVVPTESLLTETYRQFGKNFNAYKRQKKVKLLLSRDKTFVYKGTANAQKTGPEHPFPGYLTLLDILYLRNDFGQTPRDRSMNLAFRLPIPVDAYVKNAVNRPTGLNILMEFSDFIILKDAVVLGGWMRNVAAGAILVGR